jgi:hypothetical protein
VIFLIALQVSADTWSGHRAQAQVSQRAVVSTADYRGSMVGRLKEAVATLAAKGGGTLIIPRGSYALESSELALPIMLPSGVAVEGTGATLTIVGNAVIGSVFRAENGSDITIRNLRVIGNNRAIADSASGAFFNYLHDERGRGAHNITVENLSLRNFKSERWISILNTNRRNLPIRGVRIANISVTSRPGNNLGGSDIAIGANALAVYGVDAPIVDVDVAGFSADARYIKTAILIFHKVSKVRITSPKIADAGQSGTANDKGSYAINIYGNAGEMSDVVIDNPVITAPRSAGIYLRGVENVTINRPSISGQTDTEAGTLPKGAIVGNGASRVTVNGGVLNGNAFDIMVVAPASSSLEFEANAVAMLGATRAAVVLNPGAGTGSPGSVRLIQCKVHSIGRGIQVLNRPERSIRNLVIEGGEWISSGSSAFELNPLDGGKLDGYVIKDLRAAAVNRVVDLASPAGTATGDVTLSGLELFDAGVSQLKYAIVATNFPSITIDNVLIRDMKAGEPTYLTGAKARVNGLRTRNVARSR